MVSKIKMRQASIVVVHVQGRGVVLISQYVLMLLIAKVACVLEAFV